MIVEFAVTDLCYVSPRKLFLHYDFGISFSLFLQIRVVHTQGSNKPQYCRNRSMRGPVYAELVNIVEGYVTSPSCIR